MWTEARKRLRSARRSGEVESMFAHRLYGAIDFTTFVPAYVELLNTHRGHPIEVSLTPVPVPPAA